MLPPQAPPLVPPDVIISPSCFGIVLGQSGAVLGLSWDRLGIVLGGLGAVLGHLCAAWAALGCHEAVLGRLGLSWISWGRLGLSWDKKTSDPPGYKEKTYWGLKLNARLQPPQTPHKVKLKYL